MPSIKPVSDLRSYTEVLAEVSEDNPVFLTKNGRGLYAILDMRDYDRMVAAQALSRELTAGRRSGESEGWISEEDVLGHFKRRATEDVTAIGA